MVYNLTRESAKFSQEEVEPQISIDCNTKLQICEVVAY